MYLIGFSFENLLVPCFTVFSEDKSHFLVSQIFLFLRSILKFLK
jgi:hypothetical protein